MVHDTRKLSRMIQKGKQKHETIRKWYSGEETKKNNYPKERTTDSAVVKGSCGWRFLENGTVHQTKILWPWEGGPFRSLERENLQGGPEQKREISRQPDCRLPVTCKVTRQTSSHPEDLETDAGLSPLTGDSAWEEGFLSGPKQGFPMFSLMFLPCESKGFLSFFTISGRFRWRLSSCC